MFMSQFCRSIFKFFNKNMFLPYGYGTMACYGATDCCFCMFCWVSSFPPQKKNKPTIWCGNRQPHRPLRLQCSMTLQKLGWEGQLREATWTYQKGSVKQVVVFLFFVRLHSKPPQLFHFKFLGMWYLRGMKYGRSSTVAWNKCRETIVLFSFYLYTTLVLLSNNLTPVLVIFPFLWYVDVHWSSQHARHVISRHLPKSPPHPEKQQKKTLSSDKQCPVTLR